MYPTAAAALGLGLVQHYDFEEKSEAAATGMAPVVGAGGVAGGSGGCGGGSSTASTAGNTNNNLDVSGGLARWRAGRGSGAAVRGSSAVGGVSGGNTADNGVAEAGGAGPGVPVGGAGGEFVILPEAKSGCWQQRAACLPAFFFM